LLVSTKNARCSKNVLTISAELTFCNGTDNAGNCLQPLEALKLAATLTAYSLQATTINSRSNLSILSASQLSTPVIQNVDIAGYKMALFYAFDWPNQGYKIEGPSLAYSYWSVAMELNQIGQTNYTFNDIRAFYSTLVTPLWSFQINSYANPNMTQGSPNAKVTYLPEEFSTTASLAMPYTRIVINKGMFASYILLELLALLSSGGVIAYVLLTKKVAPEMSGYRLIDFAARTLQRGEVAGFTGFSDQLVDLSNSDGAGVRTSLAKNVVFLKAPDSRGARFEKTEGATVMSLMQRA
jgi:hypothetical protein